MQTSFENVTEHQSRPAEKMAKSFCICGEDLGYVALERFVSDLVQSFYLPKRCRRHLLAQYAGSA